MELRLLIVVVALVAGGFWLSQHDRRVVAKVAAKQQAVEVKRAGTVIKRDAVEATGHVREAAAIEAQVEEVAHAVDQNVTVAPVFADPDCELDAVSVRLINAARTGRAAAATGGADRTLSGPQAAGQREVGHGSADDGQ